MTKYSELLIDERVEKSATVNSPWRPLSIVSRGKKRTRSTPLVAVVMRPGADRDAVIELLRSSKCDALAFHGVNSVRRSAVKNDLNLIVSDLTIGDGNWVDVVRLAVSLQRPPAVLVHVKEINERLRSELLGRGCDPLVSPFSKDRGRKLAQLLGCSLATSRA